MPGAWPAARRHAAPQGIATLTAAMSRRTFDSVVFCPAVPVPTARNYSIWIKLSAMLLLGHLQIGEPPVSSLARQGHTRPHHVSALRAPARCPRCVMYSAATQSGLRDRGQLGPRRRAHDRPADVVARIAGWRAGWTRHTDVAHDLDARVSAGT